MWFANCMGNNEKKTNVKAIEFEMKCRKFK